MGNFVRVAKSVREEKLELFDLEADRGERRHLRAKLAEWLESMN